MQISAIIYIVLQLVVLWKMLYGKSLQNAEKYLIKKNLVLSAAMYCARNCDLNKNVLCKDFL